MNRVRSGRLLKERGITQFKLLKVTDGIDKVSLTVVFLISYSAMK